MKYAMELTGPRGIPRGFTMIELVLVIVLLGIMGGFSIQYVSSMLQANRFMSGQKDIVDEGRLAIEFMVRELRVAKDITATTSTSITFDKFSGLPQDDDATSIQYSWNAGTRTLSRASSNVTAILSTRIKTFSITTPSADLYQIDMELEGSEGETFVLRSGVRPRVTVS
ncbi:MAG: hypothetical protein COV67_00645 [Nitrospinae bacterium CG11_big_fil_rev_8_21_14_0_20_56_8]|nr:MAG: hypothetical protein COV67_00645 [Nitrospinae bacterium CG11_big_fil_rev_8_21_14_0_20_56_8]